MKNTLFVFLLLSCNALTQTIQFTEVPFADAPFTGTGFGASAFADIDDDGDPDLLITGHDPSWSFFAELYENDGAGNFSIVNGTPFEGVHNSSLAFADIDGDSDQDVLVIGLNENSVKTAKLYTNDGSGNFTLVPGTPFPGTHQGCVAFCDIDNDNDPDLLLTGTTDMSYATRLYENNGSGSFSLVTGQPFEDIALSTVGFADVDNDNDPDLVISGQASGSAVTRMYTNDGTGNFALVSGTPFTNVASGALALSDIDNDNDPDLLLTGITQAGQVITRLYRNTAGVFALVTGTPFDVSYWGTVDFGDVDNDGDNDVLIGGQNNGGVRMANLYSNDGTGTFSAVSGLPFMGINWGTVAFTDTDGDGDQDVLIAGVEDVAGPKSRLFENGGCLAYATTDTRAACDSYTWIDNVTYTASTTTPTHTLTTVNGCDSVVTLNLTIGHPSATVDVQSACNSYTWINGLTYTSDNSTATHTLEGVGGCDSVVTLNLTIHHPSSGTDVQHACNSYTWINGLTYTASNITATYTLTNAAGCDSTVTLNLTVDHVNTQTSVANFQITALMANADAYQWLNCEDFSPIAGATSSFYAPAGNGWYAVVITEGTCSDTSGCTEIAGLGMEDLVFGAVELFPNPSNGTWSIRCDAQPVFDLFLTDLQGTVVLQRTAVASGTEMQTTGLPSGVYFVRLQAGSGFTTKRLVIGQ